ncbi:MAG TPA: T9SS type A sorting domain-containing protein, partial [Bacteroidales bacterium]|nr:T9SS type A sorting domain-containing protein [Bacteroidales bacterium]
LSDASSVGSWISTNNLLAGPKYRTDSFHFTIDDGKKSPKGTLRFDNYRVIKKVLKSTGTDDVYEDNGTSIRVFSNPFNSEATIHLDIRKDDFYRLTVYDLTGRIVERLVKQKLSEGEYVQNFGSGYNPGIYIVELRSSQGAQSVKVIKQ